MTTKMNNDKHFEAYDITFRLNLNMECHWQFHDYVYEKKACSGKLDSQGVMRIIW